MVTVLVTSRHDQQLSATGGSLSVSTESEGTKGLRGGVDYARSEKKLIAASKALKASV